MSRSSARHLVAAVVLAFVLSPAVRGDPMNKWELGNSFSLANGIAGLDFGQGIFVGVGNAGTIVTSTNGQDWQREISGTSSHLTGVCFGNGQFVAVGYQAILTSSNGHHWMDHSAGIGNFLWSIAYGNGCYVSVGLGGTILRSTNGAVWIPQDAGPVSNLHDITFANGTFIAVGNGGILSSPDGMQWTSRSAGPPLESVTYGNERLVAVGNSQAGTNIVRYSSDGGITWLPALAGTTGLYLRDVAYGPSGFVAVGTPGAVLVSPDGVAWSEYPALGPAPSAYTVGFANGMYVAGGGSVIADIWTSTDALQWRHTSKAADRMSYCGVVYGNNTYVAVGFGTNLVTSVDGGTWVPHDIGLHRVLFDVAYGDGVFAAVGYAGTILTSTDATAWTAQDPGTNLQLSAITYGNRRFVAAGSYGMVLTSTNGEHWQPSPTPVVEDLQDVKWTGREFVAVSRGTDFLMSTDALIWTKRPVATNSMTNGYAFRSAAFGNGRYTIAGLGIEIISDYVRYQAAIFSSPDATKWTLQLFPAILELDRITFAHGTFVAVGTGGAILTSTNGTEWIQRNSGTTRDLTDVCYGKGRFAVVGVLGSRLQSGFYGPPVFTSIMMTSAGLELDVGGGPNQSCRLQFSEAIAPLDWHDLQNFTTTEELIRLTDDSASNSTHRAYRVVSP